MSEKYPRIAIIKTAWSENYTGDLVTGGHKYVTREGEGHERFNFLLGPRGRFYGYMPPIGKKWASPKPREKDGWLLVFVARRPKHPGLPIVGWYENASFTNEYEERPEYAAGLPFEHDKDDELYSYAVSASSGACVPEGLRNELLDTTRIKRAPVVYLRGNGESEKWRSNLASSVLRQLDHLRKEMREEGWRPKSHHGGWTPPSAEHRKQVDDAAMGAAERALKKHGYTVQRVHLEKWRGYDLLANRSRAPKELHVEVKGTSGMARHFLMSRNEKARMIEPMWRLAMVTRALLPAERRVELMTADKVHRDFELAEYTWEGREKK